MTINYDSLHSRLRTVPDGKMSIHLGFVIIIVGLNKLRVGTGRMKRMGGGGGISVAHVEEGGGEGIESQALLCISEVSSQIRDCQCISQKVPRSSLWECRVTTPRWPGSTLLTVIPFPGTGPGSRP